MLNALAGVTRTSKQNVAGSSPAGIANQRNWLVSLLSQAREKFCNRFCKLLFVARSKWTACHSPDGRKYGILANAALAASLSVRRYGLAM